MITDRRKLLPAAGHRAGEVLVQICLIFASARVKLHPRCNHHDASDFELFVVLWGGSGRGGSLFTYFVRGRAFRIAAKRLSPPLTGSGRLIVMAWQVPALGTSWEWPLCCFFRAPEWWWGCPLACTGGLQSVVVSYSGSFEATAGKIKGPQGSSKCKRVRGVPCCLAVRGRIMRSVHDWTVGREGERESSITTTLRAASEKPDPRSGRT